MIYGLWQSVGGLQAEDYRQTILANNLANANTAGFKPDRVAFTERLAASLTKSSAATRLSFLDGMTGGVFETPLYTDYSQGPLSSSENPLDVAIYGDGFLKVQTPAGVRVTRDGQLTLAKDGTLIHAASGGAVLDSRNRPIVVTAGDPKSVKIDGSGTIREGDTDLGRIAIVDFSDRQALEKSGNNLLSADKAKEIPARGEIKQFHTEESGVEPVLALTDMISASRAYQLNATMISMQDESLSRVVNELGRIG